MHLLEAKKSSPKPSRPHFFCGVLRLLKSSVTCSTDWVMLVPVTLSSSKLEFITARLFRKLFQDRYSSPALSSKSSITIESLCLGHFCPTNASKIPWCTPFLLSNLKALQSPPSSHSRLFTWTFLLVIVMLCYCHTAKVPGKGHVHKELIPPKQCQTAHNDASY